MLRLVRWSGVGATAAVWLAAAGLVCLPAARGQTSTYASMTVAGNFLNWNPGARNMQLVADNTWQALLFLSHAGTNEYKFVANGAWGTDWGDSNQSLFQVPIAGTAESTSQNIVHRNVKDGFYRFTFNDSTKAYSIVLEAYELPGTNLTRNGGFETQGTSEQEARGWQTGIPDNQGGRWGNSSRQSWRSFSGTWEVTIGAVPDGYGGWWQDVPVGQDFEIEAGANFWADVIPPYGPWTAAVQEVKIEFYGPAYGTPLLVTATNLGDIGDTWAYRGLRAVAPAGSAWARLVINVNGAGAQGSLQVDDAGLRLRGLRGQAFNAWAFATNAADQLYARGGWLVSSGQVVVADEAFGYSARLAGSASLPYVRSPAYTDGVGRVSFWYRHASTEEEGPSAPVGFRVQVSTDGAAWTTVDELTNVTFQSFIRYSRLVNEPLRRYVRVQQSVGGTNRLVLDDFTVDVAQPVQRFQDFSGWSAAASNMGCHTFNDWSVCTGRLATVNSNEGLSARLAGYAAYTNEARSPLYTNGYGTISFDYARGTNGLAPAALALQESADGVAWTTLATISNIASPALQSYSQFFLQYQARYIRIANLSRGIAAGPVDLITEGFAGGSSSPPPDWTFGGVGQYTTASSSGENPPSLSFNTDGDFVITPTNLVNPTNLTFMTMGQSITVTSQFDVVGIVSTGLVPIATLTNITNSKVTRSYPLSTNIVGVRFTYTKRGGNLAFDDVKIKGVSPSAQPPQDLVLDNIDIGEALSYRRQNFDQWPFKSQYGSGTTQFQGWAISDAMVNEEKAYANQVLRLNTAVGNSVQSHVMPDGIGNISFWYASWSATPVTLQVQISSNATTWTTLTNLVSSTTNYAYYSKFLANTNLLYFRLYHSAGSERALIDDIFLDRPRPPADVSISTLTDPAAPFTNDPVYVVATVLSLNAADNVAVTTYYRVGTSGVFSPLPMALADYLTYRTTSAIPPQATGKVVQYYLQASFTGPGSEITSPRYYPEGGSTNPASYAIPRARPGQAWINEVKYNGNWDIFDDEFIELAGPAGFNLAGWRVEILSGFNTTLLAARYTVANETVLSNEASGYGFWVLGQTNVANRDMILTNFLFELLPIGVRLLNEAGGVEQALSFDGFVSQCSRVYAYDYFTSTNQGVSLQGTGTNYAMFNWGEYVDLTPGAANQWQYFGVGPPPPTAWFSSLSMGTNVVFTLVGNTNGWDAAPYFASNMVNNATWIPVTPFNSSYVGGTNTIWFNRPPGTNYFYRVRFTQP